MNKKILIFFILLFLNFSLIFASYSFDNYPSNQFSRQISLNHSEETEVEYLINNENIFCSMKCNVKLVSNYKNSDTLNFNLNAKERKILKFKISTPTKKESNFKSSGEIIYNLNIQCINEKTNLFCNGEKQEGKDISKISTDYKLIYDLSENDKKMKIDLYTVLFKLKNQIQELNNLLFKLNSKYENDKKTIKIDFLKSEIDFLKNNYNNYKKDFKTISNKYHSLDFYSAIQDYNNLNFNDISNSIIKVNEIFSNIDNIKKKHNNLILKFNLISNNLININLDSNLFKLNGDFLILTNKYNFLLNNLINLNFSNYDEILGEINKLNLDISSFKNILSIKKNKVLKNMKNEYENEFLKINISKKINKINSAEIIKDFCYNINKILPDKIGGFNNLNKNKILNKNNNRISNNKVIEYQRLDWNKLNTIIIKINNLSKNNFHNTINKNNCVNSLNKLNFNSVENKFKNSILICNKLKEKLNTNINQNKGIINNIINFLRNIFIKEKKIHLNKLVDLEFYKNNNEFLFIPVNISQNTKILNKKYCKILIKKEKLKKLNKIQKFSGKKYLGKDIVDFNIKKSKCDNNKCYNLSLGYPILFVHGHLFNSKKDPLIESINTFNKLIKYIVNKDKKFYDAGKIVAAGSYNLGNYVGKSPTSSIYRTTYYGGAINRNGEFLFINQKYGRISDYADNLKETIDSVLNLTNRKQIKIISHSMGGLVVREYIRKYGKDKINLFVMIGTPNEGIIQPISNNCDDGFIGMGSTIECEEMTKGSIFLTKLNSMSVVNLPKKTYIIGGVYSNIEEDGIVQFENTKIKGIKNFQIKNPKAPIGIFKSLNPLHSNMLKPYYYDKNSYVLGEKIIELLNKI